MCEWMMDRRDESRAGAFACQQQQPTTDERKMEVEGERNLEGGIDGWMDCAREMAFSRCWGRQGTLCYFGHFDCTLEKLPDFCAIHEITHWMMTWHHHVPI